MRAPKLAVGDGALGFWKALREVFPKTKEQRCWRHKPANVLAVLPKSTYSGAVAAMGDLQRRGRRQGAGGDQGFARDYGAKFPKAVSEIVDAADVLLEFYNYTAEHRIHLRPTNPIESTFATVRLRSRVTEGPGCRAAGLAMAFKHRGR
ncbi:MAG: family transposase [Nocardia sp.]|nr:family transposase [Nocardia sp.]